MATLPSTIRRYGRSVFMLGSLDQPAEPVFHGLGDVTNEVDGEPDKGGQIEHRRYHSTRCGRVLWWHTHRTHDGQWVNGSARSGGRPVRVHIAHATRFARPCRQCWPEGSA